MKLNAIKFSTDMEIFFKKKTFIFIVTDKTYAENICLAFNCKFY